MVSKKAPERVHSSILELRNGEIEPLDILVLLAVGQDDHAEYVYE